MQQFARHVWQRHRHISIHRSDDVWCSLLIDVDSHCSFFWLTPCLWVSCANFIIEVVALCFAKLPLEIRGSCLLPMPRHTCGLATLWRFHWLRIGSILRWIWRRLQYLQKPRWDGKLCSRNQQSLGLASQNNPPGSCSAVSPDFTMQIWQKGFGWSKLPKVC